MRGAVLVMLVLAGLPAAAECAKPESLALLRGEQAFTQTRTLNGVKRPLVSEGKLAIESDGVTWTTTTPVEIVTRISSKGITQAIDGGKPEAVGASDNPFFAETGLIDLLRGDLSKIETRYEVKRSKRAKPEGWTLDLKPKSKTLASYIGKISVEGCQKISSILVSQASGDSIRVDLK